MRAKIQHGINRIGFSRLVEMAEVLKCGVTELIGPLGKSKGRALLSRKIDHLSEPGARGLLQVYLSIGPWKMRAVMMSLAPQLAGDQFANERPAKRRTKKRTTASRRAR